MVKRTSTTEPNGTDPRSRNILVTAAEGQTGRLIIELLLTDGEYADEFAHIHALVFSADGAAALEEFKDAPLTVHVFDPADEEALLQTARECDTLMLIPPARKDKLQIVQTLVDVAAKAKSVTNVVLLSSAGCDYAERARQPRLREFIDIEAAVLAPKSDPSTGQTAHSPVVIRAGFYAENLLLYSTQAQAEGRLPLPIDADHKFAPVALGDVALLAAHVLTSAGPNGLKEELRGQVMIATGPRLVAGPDLAQTASRALGAKLEFESISEAEAQRLLATAEIDDAEREYLLEYYALVREGKTAYVGDAAFQLCFGHRGQEPSEFFEAYAAEFKPKRRRVEKEPAGKASKPKSGAPAPKRSLPKRAAKAQAEEDEEMEDESRTSFLDVATS